MTETKKPAQTLMGATHCFYEPGQMSVYSTAILYSDGIYYEPYSGRTADQVITENPKMQLMEWPEAEKQINELNKKRFSDVTEIDEERYNEMLNVLPPMDWRNIRGADTFLVCEATTGGWHSCFVKCGGRYYEGYSNRFAENAEQRVARFLGK